MKKVQCQIFSLFMSLILTTCTGIAQERSTVDLYDDLQNEYQLHILYVIPSDGVDHHLDTSGVLADSVDKALDWLYFAGKRAIRLDTFNGKPDVTFVKLDMTNEDIYNHGNLVKYIEWQLESKGMIQDNKLYAAYYEGYFADCAAATQPPNDFGQLTVLAIGDPSCGKPIGFDSSVGEWELTLLHEVFHLLGAVSQDSPHYMEEGHLLDNTKKDLMSFGEWDPPDLVLDRGFDDYWGHGSANFVDVSMSVFMTPTIGDGSVPPGWPLQKLVPYSFIPPHSVEADTEADIRFVNMWSEEVNLYMIDELGELHFESSIGMGQQYLPVSRVGDVWIITRSRGLSPLSAWKAPHGLSQAFFSAPSI